MTRKNGFYWVRIKDNWTIAKFDYPSFWVDGDDFSESYFDEIDETPILRPSISKIKSTSQTLATLKETLADFPDSLLVTKVHIEMHNKFSIQITEFNIEENAEQETKNKDQV